MPPAKRASAAKTTTTKQVVFFDFERDPGKSAVRYTEATDGDEMIGKLYVKRALFEKLGKPEAVKVTVEADDGAE